MGQACDAVYSVNRLPSRPETHVNMRRFVPFADAAHQSMAWHDNCTVGSVKLLRGWIMPKVEFTISNLENCRCSNCPVRESSSCVASKVSQMGQSHTSGSAARMPDPQAVQMLFCSQAVGKSECTDLNASMACNCPGCSVWSVNQLSSSYFCSRGAAS